MTQTVTEFLGNYGYLTVLAAGFLEYAGVPVATVPVLVAAGGMSGAAGLDPFAVAAFAAAGGLTADLAWFALVRWRGQALVDAACGLTSNPNACVLSVEDRVARLGPAYVIPSKFIPGAGNLVAPAAGLAGMAAGRFALSDAAALLLWAGAYTALGVVFASQVQGALELAAIYQRWVLIGAVSLVAGAGAWRAARVALHRRGHAPAGDGGRGER